MVEGITLFISDNYRWGSFWTYYCYFYWRCCCGLLWFWWDNVFVGPIFLHVRRAGWAVAQYTGEVSITTAFIRWSHAALSGTEFGGSILDTFSPFDLDTINALIWLLDPTGTANCFHEHCGRLMRPPVLFLGAFISILGLKKESLFVCWSDIWPKQEAGHSSLSAGYVISPYYGVP